MQLSRTKVALSFDSGGSRWLITSGLAISFATDLVFTPTLAVALWQSRVGLSREQSRYELFTTYVVNTGLLHCIFNGAAFIACLATSPFSYTYGIPEIIATRLYANTLLCALNSRDPKKALSIFDGGSYGRNLIQRMNHRAAAETWNVPQIPDDPQAIHINVTTEAEGALDIKRDSAPQYKHHIV
ncbi:hypothetical protein BD311DRAFT_61424 [Dichomitus squalens]|uniref:DUF6534 domain-containing protein n=1 Tax=Dichomitus squalens TaxID=114155 RepID=A0A4Q9MBC1_9APHY|nr:hypothetical protein BD311DRAFT_61424 [Dichomitus squalens]